MFVKGYVCQGLWSMYIVIERASRNYVHDTFGGHQSTVQRPVKDGLSTFSLAPITIADPFNNAYRCSGSLNTKPALISLDQSSPNAPPLAPPVT